MKAQDFIKADSKILLDKHFTPSFKIEVTPDEVNLTLTILDKLISLLSGLFGKPKKHFIALDNAVTQLQETNKALLARIELLEKTK